MTVASDEIIGYGATLGYSAAQASTYTLIAGITDLEPGDLTVTKVKKTAFDSPAFAHRYRPGMLDPGEITLKILFRKALQATIYALISTRAEKWWQVVLNDSVAQPPVIPAASSWTCEGYLASLKNTVPIDDNVMADLKIQLSGLPIFVAGTG